MPTDDTLQARRVTAPSTAGVWFELLKRDGGRSGATVQNLTAGKLAILPADTKPSDGAQPGDFEIPATGIYEFPFAPKRAYWARSTVASAAFTVVSW